MSKTHKEITAEIQWDNWDLEQGEFDTLEDAIRWGRGRIKYERNRRAKRDRKYPAHAIYGGITKTDKVFYGFLTDGGTERQREQAKELANAKRYYLRKQGWFLPKDPSCISEEEWREVREEKMTH